MYIMKRIDVGSWAEFELELDKLRGNLDEHASPLLFRGQPNSQWRLRTTLERHGGEGRRFSEYYRLMTRVKPDVETLTRMAWSLSGDEDLFSREDGFDSFPRGPTYQYMIYLRHHGFPSPLLDWSRSPYVAAFFALREPLRCAEKRSVFAFCAMPKGTKSHWGGEPEIRHKRLGLSAHTRHFLQQSEYTICGRFDNGEWHFHPHDQIVGRNMHQDVLWRIDLPSKTSRDALRLLDQYNLNAFSLFGSEESLLETLWSREGFSSDH